MFGIREFRQVHRFELAVTCDDPAGGGRLRRQVGDDRNLLYDRVVQIARPGRGERDARSPLGLDFRGPAHEDRIARVNGDRPREVATHGDAFGLEGDVDSRVGLRRVADERADIGGVADAELARQRRPQEKRPC